MNSQTASWNRLEVLLNEVSVKKHAATPKNTHKTEDNVQPPMLKCLRAKKFQRPTASSNPAVKATETIATDRENTYNNTGSNTGSIQSKTTMDGMKTATPAVRSVQVCSIEELGPDYAGSGDELLEENYGSLEEMEEEDNMDELECPRIKSSDATAAPTGIFNLRLKLQQERGRRGYSENKIATRKYKSVCGITDQQIRELYRLKCQDLGLSTFGDSEDGFLQGMKKKSTTSKLCLYESGFGPRALEKLGQIIQNNAEIVQLCLRKCNLNGESIRSFARSLAMMPCLIHIELANNSFEPQDFSVLFEELAASKTLVSIDFSNYEPDKKNRFTVECLDAFRRYAQGNIFLQYVRLTNLMLEDEVVQGILSTLEQTPNLLCLNLASNNCTGKSIERLPALLSQTSIMQLDLSNTKLKKDGATQLAKAVQGFRGSQREGLELILENTQLGSDVNMIFAAFGRDTNITKLDLSNNFLSNTDLLRMENALSNNIKLMELNLSHCKLGEMGGRILALGLQKNSWLQNLILIDNDLGDSIGAQIIYALTQNHALKSLDISQNQLASDSAKALQEMVKKNPGVEKYNLSMNKFNEKEGYLLQEVLYFNDKITQFNVHHNPVKYNTIETIERIVRDNIRKMVFQTVPKLKHEVARRRVYVEGEKHAMEETVAMERVKGDVKRDVERFRETLTNLRNRSESPTIRKNEKLVAKLGKELKTYTKEQNEAIMKVRSFTDEAFIEKESYRNELEGVDTQIKQIQKKIEAKQKEMAKVSEKYEPEIKKLRAELAQLREENKFVEMYNDTISRKIKKEKKKASIINRAPNPKISDMFLATSELARHKKKEPVGDKTGHDSRSHANGLESQLHFSQVSEDPKIAREYSFALKSQHFRINKMMKENEHKEAAKKKKKRVGREMSAEELIKERIKLKIKNLLKDTEANKGNILGQITDN